MRIFIQRSGYSYDGIRRTFGPDIADRIYVLQGYYPSIPGSNARTDAIHEYTLESLETRQWVTEKEIIDSLAGRWRKGLAERQVKRSLPEMLSTYDLVRVRLSKPLKETLGIKTSGYGYVIMRRETLGHIQNRIVSDRPPRRRGRPPKKRLIDVERHITHQ